jgi:MFS family permease
MKKLLSYQRNIWIYYISQFLHSLIFTIPIWIAYYQQRITPAEISFLISGQYLMQMILELPSGALADLIGRRNTNLMGWMSSAIGYLLFPFATGFSHFLILAFVMGLGDSFRSGSEEALLYDSLKEANEEKKFDKVIADSNIIYQAGLIIATFLGGFIYQKAVFAPYILYGLSLTLGSILVAFYVEPKIDSEKFSLKNYVLQIKNGSKEAFKNEYAKILSIFYIFAGGISWSSTLYFNSYMNLELMPNDEIRGVVGATIRLMNVIIISLLLKNSKFFNNQRRILFFPFVMILGYLPGVLLDGYFGVPFVQLTMIAGTARWILLAPLTNQIFSSKYRATAISFLSFVIGFVYVGLTAVSAPIISNYGIKTMYSILGVVSMVTVLPLSLKLIKNSQKID